ncbi:MAG TPA: SOS response-associated peptidase [Solirubrobacteraceae bacterium]|jgi:putative SOS response-associated peptidase YedK|nr:SOS response-associated peptidase [Solirubrobacteraceae bacterium]
MCGRYTLASPNPGQLRTRFPLGESLEIRRRYNVAPGDDVLAVIGPDGERRAQGTMLRWGLVPSWAGDPSEMAGKTINARAETVAERPAYRQAFERRRCLIVADGFYEWSGGVPHWIAPPDGEPFAFAGLWSSWRPRGAPPELEPLHSCAIVTTAAAGPIRALHDRMPVILGPAGESTWIDPATAAGELHALLEPARPRELEFRPVSRAVNDARHDAPDCLDPPEQASLF